MDITKHPDYKDDEVLQDALKNPSAIVKFNYDGSYDISYKEEDAYSSRNQKCINTQHISSDIFETLRNCSEDMGIPFFKQISLIDFNTFISENTGITLDPFSQ